MIDVPALPEILVTADDPLAAAGPGDALVLAVRPDGPERFVPPAFAQAVAEAYGIDLEAALDRAELGSPGSTQVLDLPPLRNDVLGWSSLPRRIVLAAIGETPAALRQAGAAIARAASGVPGAALTLPPLRPDQALGLVEGLLLPAWRMPRLGAALQTATPCPRVVLGGDIAEAVVHRARAGVWGTFLARTLAATPSSTKTPRWFAQQAVDLVREAGDPRLTVEVRREGWLAEHGFDATLAVARGSSRPARLVVVRYDPEGARDRPLTLVGKGITFDTGGISLKPREAMVPMKTDMAGAAVVLAAVLAAHRLGLRRPVVGVLPLAENALAAASQRPGDVVTIGGTTVEIVNTDAEGRMVLADALAWARATLDPAALVDVATLTGAATVGLGRQHGALFATDEGLAAALIAAGERHGEEFWRMPLVEDYGPSLRSDVADLAHVAMNPHVRAGAVIAALFLRHFVGDTPWVHLDIAGPARTGAKTADLPANAPTGFGVRALLDLLAAEAATGP